MTRARRLVEDSNTKITRMRWVYSTTCSAMVRLGASDQSLGHYKVITNEDLRVSTAIQDPHVTSAADTALSWIWTVNACKDSDHSDWMEECAYSTLPYSHLFLTACVHFCLHNQFPLF